MRTRHTMTVSPPAEMIQEVEMVRKAEHRTRSELIREALRTYFSIRRVYTPTRAELRAIERARAALRRGEYAIVHALQASLGTPGRPARATHRRARATA